MWTRLGLLLYAVAIVVSLVFASRSVFACWVLFVLWFLPLAVSLAALPLLSLFGAVRELESARGRKQAGPPESP